MFDRRPTPVVGRGTKTRHIRFDRSCARIVLDSKAKGDETLVNQY